MSGWPERLKKFLSDGESFILTSHIHLDGDSVASELVLAEVLRRWGKRVVVVNQDPVPHFLMWLPGAETVGVMNRGSWPDGFDVAVALDVGKKERMGEVEKLVRRAKRLANIDHHRSNDGFGDIAVVDETASSTGEIIFRFMKAVGEPISADVASLLFTAIMTDTGRFSYDNTSPETLRAAAELIEKGAVVQDVVNGVYHNVSRGQMELHSRALRSLRSSADGRVAWVVLRQSDFNEVGAHPDETQDFPEIPRALAGVRVGLYVREIEDGRVKVSMRSNCGVDLNAFARRFGGGGHRSAAGITFAGMEIERVIETVAKALAESLPPDDEEA